MREGHVFLYTLGNRVNVGIFVGIQNQFLILNSINFYSK